MLEKSVLITCVADFEVTACKPVVSDGVGYILLLLLLHAFPAKRQGASCRQAAVEGWHDPYPLLD